MLIKARALRHTSALLRHTARSLRHRYERAQFTIHFIIKRNKKNTCSLSIAELYKHLGIFKNTHASPHFSRALKNSRVHIKLNNALSAFFFSFSKANKKRLEHERSVGRNTRRSRVFLSALQQNRAQSRLLYLFYNKESLNFPRITFNF